MPIYEYRCAGCAAMFEELVQGAAGRKVTCPECGSAAAERVPSAFAVGRAKPSGPTGEACGPGASCFDPKRCGLD